MVNEGNSNVEKHRDHAYILSYTVKCVKIHNIYVTASRGLTPLAAEVWWEGMILTCHRHLQLPKEVDLAGLYLRNIHGSWSGQSQSQVGMLVPTAGNVGCWSNDKEMNKLSWILTQCLLPCQSGKSHTKIPRAQGNYKGTLPCCITALYRVYGMMSLMMYIIKQSVIGDWHHTACKVPV